jgi:hypothetical protein
VSRLIEMQSDSYLQGFFRWVDKQHRIKVSRNIIGLLPCAISVIQVECATSYQWYNLFNSI